MEEEEIWKDIPGYEGLYEISTHGRIRGIAHERTVVRNGKVITQQWGAVERTVNLSGRYPKVNLSDKGAVKTHTLHTLMAKTFIGPRPPGKQVCHNDDNPLNTKIGNLRYDTAKGNKADTYRLGNAPIGENNPNVRYTEEFVKRIREECKTEQQKIVAQKYNIPVATVGAFCQRRTWKHVD